MNISFILILLLIFFLFWWYKKNIRDAFPSASPPSLVPNVKVNWQELLNIQSHRHTIKEYCTSKGYDYEPPKDDLSYGNCLYTQDTCNADSNPHWVSCIADKDGKGTDPEGKPCDLNQHPYLEWHTLPNGTGMCLNSQFPPSFIKNVCEGKGMGEWYKGTPDCDNDGYCTLKSSDLPSCTIKADYCDSFEMDYDSSGLGDCDVSDWQNVLESVAGKTFVRTWKRNTENMIRECRDDVFSANCAKGIGEEITTGPQIALNTLDSELKTWQQGMKDACSGDVFGSTENFGKCAYNILPVAMLQEQMSKMGDSMINGALGWIPGVPKDLNLISKFNALQAKYGLVAINAVFHAGEDAIKCFDLAGDHLYKALDNLGPVGQVSGMLIKGVVANVLKYGKIMAGIISNVVGGAIQIFLNVVAPVVFYTLHAVISAVLHPLEFLNALASDLNKIITDPIGSLSYAIDEVSKLGAPALNAVKKVGNYLKDLDGKLSIEIGQDIKKIVDKLENAFNGVKDDTENAGKAIGKAFESIF